MLWIAIEMLFMTFWRLSRYRRSESRLEPNVIGGLQLPLNQKNSTPT